LTAIEDAVKARGFKSVQEVEAFYRGTDGRGKQILQYNKDFLEKVFEVMKDGIDGGRLRVRDKDSLEGRLFLVFIALIVSHGIE